MQIMMVFTAMSIACNQYNKQDTNENHFNKLKLQINSAYELVIINTTIIMNKHHSPITLSHLP